MNPAVINALSGANALLPTIQGAVEEGAKFATHQHRKHKTNRLHLKKKCKLRKKFKLKN